MNGKPIQQGPDIWESLAEPLPMQEGESLSRAVTRRLDEVVPGEWDMTLELLPSLGSCTGSGAPAGAQTFKARLQILGVIREGVGTGAGYDVAALAAFVRAAERFRILPSGVRPAREEPTRGRVIAREPITTVNGSVSTATTTATAPGVQLQEAPGLSATPHPGGKVEDAVKQSHERLGAQESTPEKALETPAPTVKDVDPALLGKPMEWGSVPPDATGAVALAMVDRFAPFSYDGVTAEVGCPECGSRMWDNRRGKRNPKAPDFKCRDRDCKGCYWPGEAQADWVRAFGLKVPVAYVLQADGRDMKKITTKSADLGQSELDLEAGKAMVAREMNEQLRPPRNADGAVDDDLPF